MKNIDTDIEEMLKEIQEKMPVLSGAGEDILELQKYLEEMIVAHKDGAPFTLKEFDRVESIRSSVRGLLEAIKEIEDESQEDDKR